MNMKDAMAWHALSAKETSTAFGVNRATGLTAQQVQDARINYGENRLDRRKSFRGLRIIIGLLTSPLSLVLLAVGILTAFLGEWVDMSVIFIVLIVNIVVGGFQEGRARRVFDALEITQKKQAVVMRDGARSVIPSEDVVPGDILLVEGGVAVVADARLLSVSELATNEASLTGEWEAVSKAVDTVRPHAPLAERENMIWSGTSVSSGYGTAIVIATGKNTAFGQIAEDVHDDGLETRLQKSVKNLARVLMFGISAVIIFITVIGILRGEQLTDILLIGIALAVAVMPEGLPAAVTVVLAVGMEVILKKGGLVRNLLAAETLGSTTYIITDKTGTLTEGKMSLAALYTARGLAQKESTVEFEDNRLLLQDAIMASDAFVTEGEDGVVVHGRPIEKALMSSALNAGISQQDLFAHGGARIEYLQFEASRRYGASLNEHNGGRLRVYVSGSPEELLKQAGHVMVAGSSRILDDTTRAQFEHTQKTESSGGRRFIAVGYVEIDDKKIPDGVRSGEELPSNFVFVGLIAFADTVRSDVPSEIAVAKRAGIRVLMATGDFQETAQAVASVVGIGKEGSRVITGSDLEKMNDEQLLHVLRTEDLFARVVPEQKLRMVHVLRNAGEIVAMTGDGVNDAPALVSADIGIAVESGTDVAKEASDMVLLNNSFSTITAAIREGRRIGDNLRKIVGYLLSTSFSELFIIGGAIVVGAPLPLLPTQILWANVIQEGIMSFPFAFEPAEDGVMKRSPRKPTEQLVLSSQLKGLIIFTATITGVLILSIYAVLSYLGTPIEEIRTVLFVALTLDALLYMLSFKDLHQPLWRMNIMSNPWVIGALSVNISLLFLSLTFSPLMGLLSLTSLTIVDIALLLFLAIANLMTIEYAKHLFFKEESEPISTVISTA